MHLHHIYGMNRNVTTPSPSPKPRLKWIPYLLAAILFLALFILWQELASTRQSLTELQEQKSTLSGELKTAKAELDQLNSGDSSIQTRERLAATRSVQATDPVKEETETLFLQEPSVEKTTDGLTVRFGFEPDKNIELPPSITLVVRVPGNSNSKILSLKVAGGSGSAGVSPIVNATGNLGMIEGTPAELGTLSFELTVTAPVKAIIRGSEGIIDFEIDIAPDACTVRKLQSN